MTNASIFDSIAPADLGLPSKFRSFRQAQRQALDWLNPLDDGIAAACLPTGSGKTLVAAALSKLLGVKTVYLVATKALQEQVLDDFSSIGMVDVRGRANYDCPRYGDCDRGFDNDCSLSGTDRCEYTCAVDRAKQSDLIVTNYAYWLNARKANSHALEMDGWPVELLICDEAHGLEQQLSGFAAVTLYASELGTRATLCAENGVMSDADPEHWKQWAAGRENKCRERMSK